MVFNRGKSMPPKQKFTKEEVVNAALEITRRDGINALTARRLGAELDSSSRPIFTEIFTHGIATLYATKVCQFEEAVISAMLDDVCRSILQRMKAGEQ